MITASQLVGWKNLPTAEVCWGISDFTDSQKYDFYELILVGKSIKSVVEEICNQKQINFLEVDIREVVEVYEKASQVYYNSISRLLHRGNKN